MPSVGIRRLSVPQQRQCCLLRISVASASHPFRRIGSLRVCAFGGIAEWYFAGDCPAGAAHGIRPRLSLFNQARPSVAVSNLSTFIIWPLEAILTAMENDPVESRDIGSFTVEIAPAAVSSDEAMHELVRDSLTSAFGDRRAVTHQADGGLSVQGAVVLRSGQGERLTGDDKALRSYRCQKRSYSWGSLTYTCACAFICSS